MFDFIKNIFKKKIKKKHVHEWEYSKIRDSKGREKGIKTCKKCGNVSERPLLNIELDDRPSLEELIAEIERNTRYPSPRDRMSVYDTWIYGTRGIKGYRGGAPSLGKRR